MNLMNIEEFYDFNRVDFSVDRITADQKNVVKIVRARKTKKVNEF